MAYIKSRKHAVARALPPLGSAAAATLVALQPARGGSDASTNTLKEVRVEDASAADYKTDNSANPKYTAPLVDTPKTIQVVPEQVDPRARRHHADRGAAQLARAWAPSSWARTATPTPATRSSCAASMPRAASSSTASATSARSRATSSTSKQVEVVKGASGTDVGRTSPTGYVNLITKKPLLEDAFSGSHRLRQRQLQARHRGLEQGRQRRRRLGHGVPPERRGRGLRPGRTATR